MRIMNEVSTRKCVRCKEPIELKRGAVNGVILYKKLYYHSNCFCELAEKRVASKKTKWKEWQEALDSISALEKETSKTLEDHWGDKEAKDELNEYLLEKYDVTVVPPAFWLSLADISNGIYRKKRCKKTSTRTLFDAWVWGQRNLDKIDKMNKANHTGPKDGNERISYDLAILIKKLPQFLKYQDKQKAEEAERQRNLKENIKIDYNKVQNNSKESNSNFKDISSLVDSIF